MAASALTERMTMRRPPLERVRAADHAAFRALVHEHDENLRALAYRLLGSRERMDDVLQEAYVKAYRALPRFRGDSALGTWLYRIVYNACLDELRRSRRPAPVPIENIADRPSRDAGPEALTVQRDALAAALATLPPDQRAAVLLVDAQGFDYETAGEVLGVPAGTIGSRVSRARSALRRALAGEGS